MEVLVEYRSLIQGSAAVFITGDQTGPNQSYGASPILTVTDTTGTP